MRYVSVAVLIHTCVSYNFLCDCWHNSQRSTRLIFLNHVWMAKPLSKESTAKPASAMSCWISWDSAAREPNSTKSLGHFDHSILSRIFLMVYHNDWNTCFRNALQSTSKVLLATWLITWVVLRERKCFKLGNLWCHVTKFTPQIDKSWLLENPFSCLSTKSIVFLFNFWGPGHKIRVRKQIQPSTSLHQNLRSFWTLLHQFVVK